MLVNGEHDLALAATAGEVLRLYLANTANARVFNVALRGGRMKLVGGDSGRCEHELFVESVVLAPSERVVVDVLFEAPGIATLVHQTPGRSYDLATVTISEGDVDPAPTAAFGTLRTNPEWEAERERIAPYRGADPDRTIAFIAEMDLDTHGEADPHAGHGGSHGHDHAADGIEWEDEMVEANRQTTSANMRWRLVDRSSGAEDGVIDWRFRVGDQVKIRLVNELDSDHPMHHPFHIHGAGRFLVLSRDGREEPNLVWTDTVLVRTGEVIDILLDVTHPGRWMAHCHIAEHHESGMALSFEVIPREQ
jgi:FtsP/CotA-like multicopper oxidase with cupredoxin domain